MKTKILIYTLLLFSAVSFAQKKIVILHTNDTHSRIEPLPATDKFHPNTAGVVARDISIEEVRKKNKNVLLFDVGDFLQGTPYFNMFHGRVEAEAMNIMKYDAGTIGNHEFDYGIDTLNMIIDKLNFPIVSSNYDFSKTVIKNKVKPYTIIRKDGVKIGVIGLGADPEGLIQKSMYAGMIYKPAVSSANKYAEFLKKKEKCDLVICLSHIGYNNDLDLARNSRNIDIILGGHSHTYMGAPEFVENRDGKEVMIFQNGKNATFVGKIEIEFQEVKK